MNARAVLFAVLSLAAPVAFAQDVLVSSRFTSQVLRYDSATGAFKGVFASGSGMANPNGIAYGPDGNLYAGNGDEGVVLRYDGRSGAFIDRFIDTTAFAGARAIEFGPDGDLYVAAGSIDKVLRFDGRTGTLKGVAAEGHGLRGPVGLDIASDGTLVIGGAISNGVYFFRNGAFLRECRSTALHASITGVLFGAEGTVYAATAGGNTVLKVNSETCEMTSFAGSPNLNIAIYLERAADGSLLVASFNNDSVVKLDPATGAPLGVFVSSGSGGLDGTHDFAIMPAATPVAVLPAISAPATVWITNPTDAPMNVRVASRDITLAPRATSTQTITDSHAAIVIHVYGDAPAPIVLARTQHRTVVAQPFASGANEHWLDNVTAGMIVGSVGSEGAPSELPQPTTADARVTCPSSCVAYAFDEQRFLVPSPARTQQWLGGVVATRPTLLSSGAKRRAAAATEALTIRTSLTLANRNSTMATVQLDHAGRTRNVTLAANESRTIADVFDEVFDLDEAQGAIGIRADLPISATARLYTRKATETLAPVGHGTIAAVTRDSELGLFNTFASATDVTVTAYDEAGIARGAKTYRIGAGETLIVPRVLDDLGAASVALASLRVDSAVLAWTLRYESASGDPIFISAR